MKPRLLFACLLLFAARSAAEAGWIPLFDGRSLEHWQPAENPQTFRVENSVLVIHGPRAHLFYAGPVEDAEFHHFELRADVLTRPGANSGLYFHTHYQPSGWPRHGYEVQINNSHSDWRRTGSLYGINDVRDSPARDDEWFELRVRVMDRRIQIWVADTLMVDYLEPENVRRAPRYAGRRLSRGTIALQGHDPKSEVRIRRLEIRPLSDATETSARAKPAPSSPRGVRARR